MPISVHRPARIVALLALVIVVIVLLAARGVGASTSLAQADHVPVATHLVVTGDTLWDIAAGITAPGEDVRRTVFAIRQANDLEGSIIFPGQELLVPSG